MTTMELDFCRRVDNHDSISVAFIDGYGMFQHKGADHSFNPTYRRERIKQILLRNIITRIPFKFYLRVKKKMKNESYTNAVKRS